MHRHRTIVIRNHYLNLYFLSFQVYILTRSHNHI